LEQAFEHGEDFRLSGARCPKRPESVQ
jgi:hypothetical protein